MAPAACSPAADDRFGPIVGPECRNGLDFTLRFEDTILSILPAAIFSALALHAILRRHRTRSLVDGKALLCAKLLAYLVLLALRIALAAEWALSPVLHVTAIAAAVVAAVEVIPMAVLSYYDHARSLRPSTLLGCYLLTTLMFDIARVRTLWLMRASSAVTSTFTAAFSLKALALVLETIEKRRSIVAIQSKDAAPEETSGPLNRAVFWWVNPLLVVGCRRDLSVIQLPSIGLDMDSETIHHSFESAWAQRRQYSLLITLLRAFKLEILYAVVPRLCLLGFTLAQPFFIERLILFVEEPSDDETYFIGPMLIVACALIYVGAAVATAVYWHMTYRWVTMVRGSLVTAIYRKALNTPSGSVTESAALTLMGTDVEKVLIGLEDTHEVWASILQVAVAVWLLERQVSWACVVPVLLCLACVLSPLCLAARIGKLQKSWNEAVQKRLHVTADALGRIKEARLMGLRGILSSMIQNLRVEELRRSRALRKLLVVVLTISQATPIVAPVATFALYAGLSVATGKPSLLAAQAFSSLTLISILANPILVLIQAIPPLASAVSCLSRIQEYLAAENRKEKRMLRSNSSTSLDLSESGDKPTYPQGHKMQVLSGTLNGTGFSVAVKSASFGWVAGQPILKDVSFAVGHCSFLGISGPVGSGKTTLINGILGETPEFGGVVELDVRSIAYCSQSPWLPNVSIQEAITNGFDFDSRWFQIVIHACALDVDLDRLPEGARAKIGSKGFSLSQGQRQRVALARALYGRHHLVLLDDAFSGLDASTKSSVVERVLSPGGILRTQKTTVIMTSHDSLLLKLCESVLMLDEHGTIIEHKADNFELVNDPLEVAQNNAADSNADRVEADQDCAADSTSTSPDRMQDVRDWAVYRYYFKSAGLPLSLSFLGISLLVAFCYNFPTLWLKWWSDANAVSPNNNLGFYLGIYSMLAVVALIGLMMVCRVMLVDMVYKVGEKCHNRMLDIVMRVPIAFFALNDTGKTTNRFGQDLQLLDTVLPMSAINTALFAGSCLVQVVIISYAANYMAATLPVCLVVVYMVQRYYLNTSRQLRVLEIEAKTPLYSAFIELLDGLATVRAFRWEQTLEKSNYRKVQDSQTAMYLLFCIQRWLNLVLDLIVAGLAITLACLAVGLKEKSNASSIGVALSNINTFNQTLANLIKAWTTLETTMGAVARIRGFVKETKVMKDPNGNLTSTPCSETLAGMVEFQDASASYGINDDDLALSGVNMTIKRGEKIAICGRTGSGKSTLILCLARMLELASGSIMINGVDVALLSPDQLCSSLNIITQEPLIITGTVRFNASLGNSASEAELLSAFRTVGIWDLIQEKGGLDAEMQPASWSHGQRQLFCLARALLYKKPILILDEAASNVDSATEQQMQDVVNTAFKENTVISVTHRLGSIFCFDKVAVFDKGVLVEYDDPHALLEKPSVFAELYRESGAQ